MAITRSFQNSFEVQDRTPDLLRIPTEYHTIGSLGLFQEEGVSTNTVTFEEQFKDGALIVDKVRGERSTVGKDYNRKIHAFAIPHFPYDDAITPQDIQGKRAYGNNDIEETLAAVRLRKMERIARNHAWTLEVARAKAITTGDVYAPSGTVSQNWYTEFGVTQTTLDFTLGTGTTEVLLKQEEIIQGVQDGLQNGAVVSGIAGLCSTSFFNKLITHPTVKAAYANWTNSQDPTRSRVGLPAAALNRRFSWGGIDYYEMRDQFNGTPLIPAGDCYFVPTGSDIFKTYFAPANKFEFVNTVGERMYMFEYQGERGDKIEIETETNFANMVTAPKAVIRGYTSN